MNERDCIHFQNNIVSSTLKTSWGGKEPLSITAWSSSENVAVTALSALTDSPDIAALKIPACRLKLWNQPELSLNVSERLHPRLFVIHNELPVRVDRLVEVGAAEVTDVLTSSLFRIRRREYKLKNAQYRFDALHFQSYWSLSISLLGLCFFLTISWFFYLHSYFLPLFSWFLLRMALSKSPSTAEQLLRCIPKTQRAAGEGMKPLCLRLPSVPFYVLMLFIRNSATAPFLPRGYRWPWRL